MKQIRKMIVGIAIMLLGISFTIHPYISVS